MPNWNCVDLEKHKPHRETRDGYYGHNGYHCTGEPTLLQKHFSDRHLLEVLENAEVWTQHGNTEVSRAYWQGMRDTLRVFMGITNEPPSVAGPDADIAALELLRGV